MYFEREFGSHYLLYIFVYFYQGTGRKYFYVDELALHLDSDSDPDGDSNSDGNVKATIWKKVRTKSRDQGKIAKLINLI